MRSPAISWRLLAVLAVTSLATFGFGASALPPTANDRAREATGAIGQDETDDGTGTPEVDEFGDPLEPSTWFDHDNIPGRCLAEMDEFLADGETPNPDYWFTSPPEDANEDGRPDEHPAVCHHMATDMNGLDSPKVDVLVMVPISPTAERDMRIMRQSIEMWEAGIDALALQMDMQWLAEGMDFDITVQPYDVNSADPGELTPYPVVDPEIVVIASNPVGGIGIGIDPVDFIGQIGMGDGELFCHGVPTALGFEGWEGLPGFDRHHDHEGGTYVEDCGGEGGNVCFAVNGALDPVPGETAFYDNVIDFNLFDLVSHEVGHCLTIGHVGDGAEGDWGQVPTNDIMAYHPDPVDITKCVSSLNVAGIATVMARHLDVDGNGTPGTEADQALVLPNDQETRDGRPFVVHRPLDQRYASSTGVADDCPQPDQGLVPGTPTDWSPDPGA